MSSYAKKKIDFSELEDHFESDTHPDSIKKYSGYHQEIDSAIQIKNQSTIDKLHEVQQSLQFSPHSGQKLTSAVRCSFGVNSNINPLKLQFISGNNSVRQSLQAPDTAQFPLQKKFQKVYNVRSSIEELSAENDISQSREYNPRLETRNDTRESKNKYNLTIDTDEEITEFPNEEDQDEQQRVEEFFNQLVQELQSTRDENQQLQIKLSQVQALNAKLQKQNIDIAQTLDQTQKSLQDLSETNALLKKKLATYKQQISTDYSQHTARGKENNMNDSNSQSKQQSKVTCTLQNVCSMLTLMVQKCFYLDEGLDQQGKDISNKLITQINNQKIVFICNIQENIILNTEELIRLFENRFESMVNKSSNLLTHNSILDQIQQLINDRPL